MVLAVSSAYNAMVTGAHQLAVRVRVYHGGTEVTPVDGVPVVDGSVSMSLTSRVTRTLDLQVPFEFYPHDPTDLLSPYRATVRIEAGYEFLDGSQEVFPIFTGRIYEAALTGDGGVQLRADDLAADVIAYRFEQPQSSQPFYTVVQQIQLLINDAVSGATFGVNDVTDAAVPALTWDEDRGQALDDLAASLQARWYTLGDGSFVVRRYPYMTSSPVAVLSDAEFNGVGILSSATKTITRDATANSITVLSERMDGSDPIRVTRRNTDAASDTQFGGLYGKVSQILRPQTPLTVAQADALAREQLTASVALTEQWDLSLTPIHVLEPGDTIEIDYRGVQAFQVIDSMSIPLTTDGFMSIRTRGSIPEPLES